MACFRPARSPLGTRSLTQPPRPSALEHFPATNRYCAEVRGRVANAFAEKANELADAIAVVQGLSKDMSRLLAAAAAAAAAMLLQFI